MLASHTAKATNMAKKAIVKMRSPHVMGPTCLLNSFQFISAAALSIEPVNLFPADFIPVQIRNMISAMPIIAHVSGDIGKNHIINPFFAAKLILIPESCKGKSLFLQIGLAAVVDDGQQERLVAAAGALDTDEPVLGAAEGLVGEYEERAVAVVVAVHQLDALLDDGGHALLVAKGEGGAVYEAGHDPVDKLGLLGRHRAAELV